MKFPYVGVTGPTTVNEVRDVSNAFLDHNFGVDAGHRAMLGFLVSHRTLNHQHTNNRRYPVVGLLPDLLSVVPRGMLTMVHYNSRELETLDEQMLDVMETPYHQGLCQAIQLNIPWPFTTTIEKVKRRLPGLEIVIQLSRASMEGLNLAQISERVYRYKDLADHVLIDPSGGQGREFDLETSARLYEFIKEKCPGLTIGFAGGLSGDNVEQRVSKLRSMLRTSHFSIDAEGHLRDKRSDQYGDDDLSLQRVNSFLAGTVAGFS
jgi:hypothetical protein